MKLTNRRLDQSVVVENAFNSESELKPLAQLNRTFGGEYYVNYFGLDETFKIKGRITGADNYNTIKSFIKDKVVVSDFTEAGVDYSGEYLLEKFKIKEFSFENEWWHVELELKKYFVKR